MFRAAYRSSSGALTVYLQALVYIRMWWPAVVKFEWEQFPLRLDYGRSPHTYVNQRLQIQLELLVMSGMPLETCWAVDERWNNKFCYKVASCWLFILSRIFWTNFRNVQKYWSSWKYVQREPSCSMRTDRRDTQTEEANSRFSQFGERA
jgi:hypothetical protein